MHTNRHTLLCQKCVREVSAGKEAESVTCEVCLGKKLVGADEGELPAKVESNRGGHEPIFVRRKSDWALVDNVIPKTPEVDASIGRTSLRPFIHGECCNSHRDDGCLVLESMGCLVLLGRRCSYFEQAVLPLLTTSPNKHCLQEYPDAASEYSALHKLTGLNSVSNGARVCLLCGECVGPYVRYCEKCAKARIRQAARNRIANKRQKAV